MRRLPKPLSIGSRAPDSIFVLVLCGQKESVHRGHLLAAVTLTHSHALVLLLFRVIHSVAKIPSIVLECGSCATIVKRYKVKNE